MAVPPAALPEPAALEPRLRAVPGLVRAAAAGSDGDFPGDAEPGGDSAHGEARASVGAGDGAAAAGYFEGQAGARLRGRRRAGVVSPAVASGRRRALSQALVAFSSRPSPAGLEVLGLCLRRGHARPGDGSVLEPAGLCGGAG